MIQINDTVLATAVEQGMDEFLQVFTDAYLDEIGGELTS